MGSVTTSPAPSLYGLCECGCGSTTRLAPYTDSARGWVKGEPLRFLRGHAGVAGLKKKVGCPPSSMYEVRDCGYETCCWVWTAHRDTKGYGRVSRAGYDRAYRWIWSLYHGDVPPGKQLDHLCRNRACVNPDHLEVVTNAENARRGARAKLTSLLAEEIRERYKSGGVSQPQLARQYGVSQKTIWGVVSGNTWGDQ
jgi:hypothetical protein